MVEQVKTGADLLECYMTSAIGVFVEPEVVAGRLDSGQDLPKRAADILQQKN